MTESDETALDRLLVELTAGSGIEPIKRHGGLRFVVSGDGEDIRVHFGIIATGWGRPFVEFTGLGAAKLDAAVAEIIKDEINDLRRKTAHELRALADRMDPK